MMNSDELSKYYNMINKFVDEYTEDWKINPTNLRKYFLANKSKLQNFLEKRGLNDIKHIEVVLKDVIEHRESLYKDSIMTFESFKVLENVKPTDLESFLFVGIDKANISHEKFLSDVFDTSLSQIDVLNSGLHLFRVTSVDSSGLYYIFLESELAAIKSNLIDYVVEKMFTDSYTMEVGGVTLSVPLNVIDSSELESALESIVGFNVISKVVCGILLCDLVVDEFSENVLFIGKVI